jgi:hypothetical protein
MSDAEQRDIAEALFEPKQSRQEIKDAIKLEEARRAATTSADCPMPSSSPSYLTRLKQLGIGDQPELLVRPAQRAGRVDCP